MSSVLYVKQDKASPGGRLGRCRSQTSRQNISTINTWDCVCVLFKRAQHKRTKMKNTHRHNNNPELQVKEEMILRVSYG